MPATREHVLRANLASEHRKSSPDPGRILDLRRQLAAQQLEDSIRRILGRGPALTVGERQKLAGLVLAGGAADD
jgi:hypothetical protein